MERQLAVLALTGSSWFRMNWMTTLELTMVTRKNDIGRKMKEQMLVSNGKNGWQSDEKKF